MATTYRHQITVDADAIGPGDRTSKAGKTRYVLKHVIGGKVHWRIQTTGARSATVRSFEPGERVTVWRQVPTFNSTTYTQTGAHILRTVDTLTETLYVDGGVLPQRIVASRASEVYSTDADYDEARAYVADIAEGEWMAGQGI